MKHSLTIALISMFICGSSAAVLAAATPANAQSSQETQYSVVREGDNAISCSALASEINGAQRAADVRASRAGQGRRLFGLASSALQVAGPLMGSLGGGSGVGSAMGAVVAQGATAAAVQHAASFQPAADDGVATSPQAQRRQRLLDIFNAKGC